MSWTTLKSCRPLRFVTLLDTTTYKFVRSQLSTVHIRREITWPSWRAVGGMDQDFDFHAGHPRLCVLCILNYELCQCVSMLAIDIVRQPSTGNESSQAAMWESRRVPALVD